MIEEPLLWGDESNEVEKFDSERDLVEGGFDTSYIGGYSELQKAKDIAKADEATLSESIKRKYYKRFGTEPYKSKYEFAWPRVSSPSGDDSHTANRDLIAWYQQGYTPVTVNPEQTLDKQKAEFRKKYGYDFPRAARVAPDGTIRRLDTALFVVDGERARRNEARQRAKNEKFHGINQPRFGEKTKAPFDFEIEEEKTVKLGSTFDYGEIEGER